MTYSVACKMYIYTRAQMVFVYYIRACTAATALGVAAVQDTELKVQPLWVSSSAIPLHIYWTPLALPKSSSSSL